MEALAVSLGLSIAMLVGVSVVVSLLFPVFWVWMLIDALVRDTTDYPGKDVSEKVMWVILMALIQPVAVVYFFVVWNRVRLHGVAPTTAAVV